MKTLVSSVLFALLLASHPVIAQTGCSGMTQFFPVASAPILGPPTCGSTCPWLATSRTFNWNPYNFPTMFGPNAAPPINLRLALEFAPGPSSGDPTPPPGTAPCSGAGTPFASLRIEASLVCAQLTLPSSTLRTRVDIRISLGGGESPVYWRNLRLEYFSPSSPMPTLAAYTLVPPAAVTLANGAWGGDGRATSCPSPLGLVGQDVFTFMLACGADSIVGAPSGNVVGTAGFPGGISTVLTHQVAGDRIVTRLHGGPGGGLADLYFDTGSLGPALTVSLGAGLGTVYLGTGGGSVGTLFGSVQIPSNGPAVTPELPVPVAILPLTVNLQWLAVWNGTFGLSACDVLTLTSGC